jgi:hypothetical protein
VITVYYDVQEIGYDGEWYTYLRLATEKMARTILEQQREDSESQWRLVKVTKEVIG